MPTNVLFPDGKEVLMLDEDLPLRWTHPVATTGKATPDLRGMRAELFRVWTFDQMYARKQPFRLTRAAEARLAGYDALTDTPIPSFFRELDAK